MSTAAPPSSSCFPKKYMNFIFSLYSATAYLVIESIFRIGGICIDVRIVVVTYLLVTEHPQEPLTFMSVTTSLKAVPNTKSSLVMRQAPENERNYPNGCLLQNGKNRHLSR